MTLQERVRAYNLSPLGRRYRASHLWLVTERGLPVVYGVWQLGNDYRNASPLYGAYPPGYLPRVLALFPDVPEKDVLHAFSGSLPNGAYTRLDLNPARYPDVQGSVYEAHALLKHQPAVRDRRGFALTLADPPYTAEDAKAYDTPMVDRRRATEALAAVTRPGGFLGWLDTTWPMHRKVFWRTAGRIAVVRSTNHRVRMLTLFERM